MQHITAHIAASLGASKQHSKYMCATHPPQVDGFKSHADGIGELQMTPGAFLVLNEKGKLILRSNSQKQYCHIRVHCFDFKIL